MSKHTPEPWNIYFNSQDDLVIRKMFADGQESHVVARCHSGAANARRIVACVNACEGFSIEELDGANLFKDSIESDAEILDLKKQRDELLVAVQYAADVFAEYVALHKAKGATGAEKAQSNQRHLQVMLEAIAKSGDAV